MNVNNPATIIDDRLWDAVVAKDSRFDGQFVFAVTSTKIYCRPVLSVAATASRARDVF
jgi:methylphosphotriester-DNA--protein-cysteine methyltransferase